MSGMMLGYNLHHNNLDVSRIQTPVIRVEGDQYTGTSDFFNFNHGTF